LRWSQGSGQFSLTQSSAWPYDSSISFVVDTSTPAELTLHFRIPQWTVGASLAVNGKRWIGPLEPGTFAAVRRTWKSGDRVELEIPLPVRLEALDPQHPNTVAVMRGPLVLFALKPDLDTAMPPFRRNALLGIQQLSQREWQADGGNAMFRFVPFTEVGSEPYTTYVQTN
jgi:uncharacterized protein